MITKSSLKCEQFDQSMSKAIYDRMNTLANERKKVYLDKFDNLVTAVTAIDRGTFMSMIHLFGNLSIAHQKLLTKDGSLMSPDWDNDDSKYEMFLDVFSDMLFEIAIFANRFDIKISRLSNLAKFDKLQSDIRKYKKGNFNTMTQLFGELAHRYQRSLIGSRNSQNDEWNHQDPRSRDVFVGISNLLQDLAIFAKRHDMSLNIAFEHIVTRLEDEL